MVERVSSRVRLADAWRRKSGFVARAVVLLCLSLVVFGATACNLVFGLEELHETTEGTLEGGVDARLGAMDGSTVGSTDGHFDDPDSGVSNDVSLFDTGGGAVSDVTSDKRDGTVSDVSVNDAVDDLVINDVVNDRSSVSDGAKPDAPSTGDGGAGPDSAIATDVRDAGTTDPLVSIEISPLNASIPLGTQQQFIAKGTYASSLVKTITAEVTWSSTNVAVLGFKSGTGMEGLASGNATGMVTVTAKLGSVTQSTGVTVVDVTLTDLTIGPTNGSVAKGSTLQMTATGSYSDQTQRDLTTSVAWTSTSNVTVNATGRVTGVNEGVATITASLAGKAASTQVTVTRAVPTAISIGPSNQTIGIGAALQLIATAYYADGSQRSVTDEAAWSSADSSSATVGNASGSRGLVTGVKQKNNVAIAATFDSVSNSTTVNISGLQSIEVTPANSRMMVATTQQFTAIGVYANGDRLIISGAVDWVSQCGCASIDNSNNKGLATAFTSGQTTISASYQGITGSTPLTVDGTVVSIAITPSNPQVSVGLGTSLKATATLADASTNDVTKLVTWSSSATNIASVTATGEFIGHAAGMTSITAAFGNISGTAIGTVVP